MEITTHRVATIHYTLKDDAGKTIDSSSGGEPLVYLHGAGNIVPGLEKALAGKQKSDKVSVSVPAAEGYGERQEALVQQVPLAAFKGVKQVKPGMRFQAETAQGPVPVMVTKVENGQVTVDGNHALAGQTLHFDVEVVSVRDATTDEIMHGHAHGPGGHHHH